MSRFALVPLALSLAGVMALGACASTGGPSSPAAAKARPILLNLTSGPDHLHSASMGLALARSALEDGHPVVVFLNVDGAAFADRGLGDDVRFEDFPPVAKLLRDILAKGGRVFVCRHCAGVMKVRPEDFVPGMVPATHADVLGALRPGTVSFTY